MVFEVRRDPALFKELLPQLLAHVVALELTIRPTAVAPQLLARNRALLDKWHATGVTMQACALATPLEPLLTAVGRQDAGSPAARAALEQIATETEHDVELAAAGTAYGHRRSDGRRKPTEAPAAPVHGADAVEPPPDGGVPMPADRPSPPPPASSPEWDRQWTAGKALAATRCQQLQQAITAATAAPQPPGVADTLDPPSSEWQLLLEAQAKVLTQSKFSSADVAHLTSPLSTPAPLLDEEVWQHVPPLLEALVSLLLLELRKDTPAGSVVRMLVHLDAFVAYFTRCSRLPLCVLSSWTKLTSDPRGDIYRETVKGRGGRLYPSQDSIHGQALDAGARALGETSRHDLNALDLCPFTDAAASEDNPHTEPGADLLKRANQLFAKHVLPLLLQLQPLMLVQQEACCRSLLAAVRGDSAAYTICNVREATEPLLAEQLGEHPDGDDEAPRLVGDQASLTLGCFPSDASKAHSGLFAIKLRAPPLTGLPATGWMLTSFSYGAKLSCRSHVRTPDGLFAYASTISNNTDVIRSLIAGDYVQPTPLDESNQFFQLVAAMTGATPSDTFSRSRVASGLTPSVAGGRRSARLRGELANRLGLGESDLDFQSLLRIMALCLCKFAIRSGGPRSSYEDWTAVCTAYPTLARAAAAESGRRRTAHAARRLSDGQLAGLGYGSLSAIEAALGSHAVSHEQQQRVRALVPPPACDSALAGELVAMYHCTGKQAAALMAKTSISTARNPAFCASLGSLSAALGLTTFDQGIALLSGSVAKRLGDPGFIELLAALRERLGLDTSQFVTLLCDSVAVRLGDPGFIELLASAPTDFGITKQQAVSLFGRDSAAARLMDTEFRTTALRIFEAVGVEAAFPLVRVLAEAGALTAHSARQVLRLWTHLKAPSFDPMPKLCAMCCSKAGRACFEAAVEQLCKCPQLDAVSLVLRITRNNASTIAPQLASGAWAPITEAEAAVAKSKALIPKAPTSKKRAYEARGPGRAPAPATSSSCHGDQDDEAAPGYGRASSSSR